jgi:hypothetical protein
VFIFLGLEMGSVKLKSDGSIKIDQHTQPLRDNAVLMLEGLNELIARFDGLAAGAATGAAQNTGAAQLAFHDAARTWKIAADEVRALRDRFSDFQLEITN